jgi:hypothetical protein
MQSFPFQSSAPPPRPRAQETGRPVQAPCPDPELRRAISQLRQTLDRLPE